MVMNPRTVLIGFGLMALIGFAIPAAANTLIADSYNHRVIEVTPAGSIVWQYGTTGQGGSGTNHLSRPVDVARFGNGNTLIVDQTNQRVIEVDRCNNVIWQYGTTGAAGAGTNQLNYPSTAMRLANGNTLIADSRNNRIIEVTQSGTTAWVYGTSAGTLNTPSSAVRLGNGNTLITDSRNHRVIEVTSGGALVWQYGTTGTAGSADNQLNSPLTASRLESGDTLITDKDNSRVIEVTPAKAIVWQYGTTGVPGTGTNKLTGPFASIRLSNGNTLIVDESSSRIIEVNPQRIVIWQYGITESGGSAANELRNPTRARRVADTVRKADLLVQNSGESASVGNDIYNLTGLNQTKTQTVTAGTAAVYFFTVQNDGNAPDTFRLTGTASSSGWTVNYFDSRTGGNNVTSRVSSGGMNVVLCSGGQQEFRLEVLPAPGLAAGARKDVLVTATSVANSAARDVVKASTALPAPRSNVLITDSYGHRVIEVNPAGNIVWQYGTGTPGSGANQLNYPYRASRAANGNTLIADHDNDRVIEVRPDKTIVWQYDRSAAPNDDPNRQYWGHPLYAERLSNGNTLITAIGTGGSQQANSVHELIELNPAKVIVWLYERLTSGFWPGYAERLSNGNTLVSEFFAKHVIEVTPAKAIVWKYGSTNVRGCGANQLDFPAMAVRLSNGNTLITDTGYYPCTVRIIEVTPGRAIVWQYDSQLVQGAVRLNSGNTLITEFYRVIEVDANKNIVWQYGTGSSGSGPNQVVLAFDARPVDQP